MDAQTLTSLVAMTVTGAVGVSGVLINLRNRTDKDILERASRRTMALQMLSDEELALQKVREECRSFQILVEAHRDRLEGTYESLKSSADRVVIESKELLSQVQEKRKHLEPKIRTLSADEIEDVIASAYHGKMMADAQLFKTTKSKADTIRIYIPTANPD